jgi:hypothetical protein
MARVVVFLKVAIVCIFAVFTGASMADTPVCALHMVLNQWLEITLLRDTSSCESGGFDQDEFNQEVRVKLADGLPVQCHEKFQEAVNCCL